MHYNLTCHDKKKITQKKRYLINANKIISEITERLLQVAAALYLTEG